jgi:hypothetical protein
VQHWATLFSVAAKSPELCSTPPSNFRFQSDFLLFILYIGTTYILVFFLEEEKNGMEEWKS